MQLRLALLGTIASAVFCVPASGQRSADADQITKVEEQFRLAKLNRDTQALGLILAENFCETNQNGNGRNKAQTIELWTSFPINSLKTDSADARITGDTAIVTGSQSEHNGTGVDRLLYMRIYIRAGSTWQLLVSSSTTREFKSPRDKTRVNRMFS